MCGFAMQTRRLAREAEGAPLLREYGVKSSIEGSNPSVSASSPNPLIFMDFRRACSSMRLDTWLDTQPCAYRIVSSATPRAPTTSV